MYNRITALLLAVLLSIIPASAFAEGGFSSNPDAIEQAAKSVLMLQVFDVDNEMIATGSGFVAFNNRTIVTNHHVIEGADWMMANSDDGYQYMVTKVLAADEEKDIAICEFMSPTDLQPLEFNADGELKRAESIVAIGSPIGITNTVSLGNISALYEEENVSWIQFTAPISHGSSGGALFDNSGKIIGVTSASYLDTQNLNLAVHISEVEALYDSWDGVASGFDEYLAITNATPTPVPTVTPAPTPEPTATPNPPRYSVLRIGDIGVDVVRLQKELIRLGYLKGSPGAEFESSTEKAVRLFNIQNFGLVVSIADERMQQLLYEGNPKPYVAPTPSPVADSTPKHYEPLKKGDKGESVKKLQTALIRLGYLNGTADGIYGDQTAEAVAEFNFQNFGSRDKVAQNKTQRLLFDGNPKPFEDIDMALTIKNGAYAEWYDLSGDKLKIHFQVTNQAKKKTVKAFELFLYATDVWGNKIYGTNMIYNWTTTKTVSPGQTVYSDYITIPNRSDINEVYCGIHKMAYADGTVYTVPYVNYTSWDIY